MFLTLNQWRAAQLGLHGPVALSLDRNFCLREHMGDTLAFGFELADGEDVRDTLPLLYGFAIDEDVVLDNITLPGGQVVDLQTESHAEGAYVLIRDARQRHDAVRQSQQERNEIELLRRRLSHALEVVEQASEAKSRFIAGMSHEFRTPLTSIQGYAQRWADHPDAQLAEPAGAVLRASDYLLTLVENLIDQGRLDSSELVIEPQAAQMQELLALLREIFQPLCMQRGLQLSIEQNAAVPAWLELDITRLRQIAVNLLGNACKFTRQGAVACSVSWQQDELSLQVTDTGPGIAADNLERVFAAFERVNEQAPGAGLGLAISRQIARRMGGELSLQSTLGEGSVFTLTLPAAACDPPASQAVATQSIVLAEDDHMIARLLMLVLEDAGHRVTHFADGAQAAAWFDAASADCLISDMNLPGLSGPELIAQVRQKRPQCRIITLSASVSTSDKQRAMQAGADVYESKPIDHARLLAAVAGERA